VLYDLFCSEYELLDGKNVEYEKIAILRYLYSMHGYQKNEILSSINTCLDSQNDDHQFILAADRLHNIASCPTYVNFLRNVGHLKRGVKFLVSLRADVLHYLSLDRTDNEQGFQVPQNDITSLKILNGHLLHILCTWFNPGQLYIKPIMWSSSCELVEKIAKYEAVHRFKSWSDAKKRLGPYRRCFTLMHPSMKEEPLILLYVALTKNIECRVKDITDHNISVDEVEDESKINTAMFYSISSTQKGSEVPIRLSRLHGVDLGNIIIKLVAKELAYEFPKLTLFCTLSPIPQFNSWLCSEINLILKSRNSQRQGISKLLHQNFDGSQTKLERFKQSLTNLDWISDSRNVDHYRSILMQSCAHYIFKVKRRGLAYDPVGKAYMLKKG
uniref:Malonyl-CoA decarboxylase n=1 Tax=Romanomermis culicivorax TaxID=13658 RepID=A0A915IX56_ROMCU